jgi:trehalose utilization protein
MKPIRVTIWNEYRHEKTDEKVQRAYPNGIHNAIAAAFADPLVGGSAEDFTVKTATLDEPEHGLTKDVLDTTDVLFWRGVG